MAEIVWDKTIKMILVIFAILAILVFILWLAKPAIFDWLINQAPSYNYTHDSEIILTPDQLAKFDCVIPIGVISKDAEGKFFDYDMKEIFLIENNKPVPTLLYYKDTDNTIRVRVWEVILRPFGIYENPKVGILNDNKIVIYSKYLENDFTFERRDVLRTRKISVPKEIFIKLNGAKLLRLYTKVLNGFPLCKTKEEYEKDLEYIKKLTAPEKGGITEIYATIKIPDESGLYKLREIFNPFVYSSQKDIFINVTWKYGIECNSAKLYHKKPNEEREIIATGTFREITENMLSQNFAEGLTEGTHLFEAVCIVDNKEISKKELSLISLNSDFIIYYIKNEQITYIPEFKSGDKPTEIPADSKILFSKNSNLFDSNGERRYTLIITSPPHSEFGYSSNEEGFNENKIIEEMKKLKGEFEISFEYKGLSIDPAIYKIIIK